MESVSTKRIDRKLLYDGPGMVLSLASRLQGAPCCISSNHCPIAVPASKSNRTNDEVRRRVCLGLRFHDHNSKSSHES